EYNITLWTFHDGIRKMVRRGPGREPWQISRIVIVSDLGMIPGFLSGFAPSYLSSIATAAKEMAVEAVRIPVRTPAEVAQAIPAFAAQPNGGLLVIPGGALPDTDLRAGR